MRIVGNKAIIMAAAALGAAACLAYLAATAPRPIAWREGAAAMYRVNFRTSMMTRLPNAPLMERRLLLKGTLNMRVLGASGDAVRAAFQYSNLEVRAEGEIQKGAAELFSKMFFADISRDGRFREFHFDPSIADEDARGISDTLRNLQFVIGSRWFSSWETEERDGNGYVVARYRYRDGNIFKSKERYTASIDRQGFVDNDADIRIKGSSLTVTYGGESPWLTSAEGRETVAFGGGTGALMKGSTAISVRILPYEPDASLAIWKDGSDAGGADGLIARWKAAPRNPLSLAMRAEEALLLRRTGAAGFESLVDGIFAKSKDFNSQAVSDLVKYLMIHPDAAGKFPALMKRGALTKGQRIMLVHALGRAGHEQAQKSLADIMNDRAIRPENRVHATITFGAIQRPSRHTVESLLAAYEKLSPLRVDRDISSSAIIALGNLAGRLNKSADDEEKYRARAIRERISAGLGLEGEDAGVNKRIALMHAAANTRDTEFLEPVSRYLSSEGTALRSQAALALGNMRTREANVLLNKKLSTELNAGVSGSLVKALTESDREGIAVDTVVSRIMKEENEILRGFMYRYLSNHRESSEVQTALRELMKTEKHKINRQIIHQALAPK